MPVVENRGARIFWRENGSGEPLLLIMGLGYSSDMWQHIEPILAGHCRVIVFDNRGIGRSEVASGPHSIETMASDAAAVLDAAGLDTAHVFGVSMGGYIAQELALQHPQRVRSLILGSTACGGENVVLAEQEVLDLIAARQHMTAEEGIRVMVPYIYNPATPTERIEADLDVRLRNYPSTATYVAQLQGIAEWESFDRLGHIAVPTLVMHGELDRLVPPQNGRLLAEKIPNARLEMFPEASHLLFTDQPEQTASTVLRFLESRKPDV